MNENAYIDRYLTTFAADTPPLTGLIAAEVAPPVLVPGKKFKYKEYSGITRKAIDDIWPKGSRAQKLEENATWQSDSTVRHGLEMDFDDEDKNEFAGPGTIQENLAVKTRDAVLLQREIAFKNFMETAGNFDNTGTPSTTWDDNTADIVSDIQDAASDVRKATWGAGPNLLVVSRQTFDKMIVSDQLLDWKKRNAVEAVTAADLAKMTKIPRVVIADAVYDSASADESETVTKTYLYGKHAWLVYVNPRPSNYEQSFAYHFVNKKQNGLIKKWYEQGTETTVIRYCLDYVLKQVNSGAAYFFNGAVS